MSHAMLAVWLLFLAEGALGGNPPFSAECDSSRALAYRHGVDIDSQPMKDSWGEEAMTFTNWRFLYTGKDIVIDGRPGRILAEEEGMMIVSSISSSSLSIVVWSYAINLALGRIVAAELNPHTIVGDGVMGRLVELKCKLQIHERPRPTPATVEPGD